MENYLSLVKILKNAPKGTKLWSPVIGECEFVEIVKDYKLPIRCKKLGDISYWHFSNKGCFVDYVDSECVLFPSKENRDWKTFKIPKEHKHFVPFQKVLIRMWTDGGYFWVATEYSNYDKTRNKHYLVGGFVRNDDDVIPYEGNEDKLGKYTKSEND